MLLVVLIIVSVHFVCWTISVVTSGLFFRNLARENAPADSAVEDFAAHCMMLLHQLGMEVRRGLGKDPYSIVVEHDSVLGSMYHDSDGVRKMVVALLQAIPESDLLEEMAGHIVCEGDVGQEDDTPPEGRLVH